MPEEDVLQVAVEVVTDEVELAKARHRREQFKQNAAWLEAHARQIYSQHRGKCICVAGEEMFVADSPEAVYAMAHEAHPDDEGFLLRYIPIKKVPRIYGHLR